MSRHPRSHLCRDINICVATRFVTPTKRLGRKTKIQVTTSKPVPSSIYVATSKFVLRHRKTPTACGHVLTSRFMLRPRYPSPKPNPDVRSTPVSWLRAGARCCVPIVSACMPSMRTPRCPCHDTTCCVATQGWKWAVAPPFGPLHPFFFFLLLQTTKICLITSKATGTWKTHQNVYIIQKGVNLQFVFNYKLPKLGLLPRFLQNT